ncbi:MAG: anion transporter, partial [Methanosarcinaceae archaeon]|nr:anion transporter [Methanosarcinaceae archaeon]
MQLIGLIIFVLAYTGIVFTRIPGINVGRPAAAFIGAVLMILSGVLTFDEAISAIDFRTIALLFGMMVVAANLGGSGFFNMLSSKAISFGHTPKKLMLVVVIVTALSSAFFVNDIVVLIFAPLVIRLCLEYRLNPVPYLISTAMASNIGSTMSIVGNPQNMLIGVQSGISFTRFMIYLAPVTLVSILILIAVLFAFYKKDLLGSLCADKTDNVMHTTDKPHIDKNMMESSGGGDDSPGLNKSGAKASLFIPIFVMVLFFADSILHIGLPLIALSGAALVFIMDRGKPSQILKNVDWVLLLFFAGLFIVIEGAVRSGVFEIFDQIRLMPDAGGIVLLHILGIFGSQIVSNVPFTMFMIPYIAPVSSDVLWISLASGATLAGNLTLIGAISNIIVVEMAAKSGIYIKFSEFFKIGFFVTLLSMFASLIILMIEYQVG